MTRIVLSADAGGTLLAHLQTVFPDEGCGLLVGQRDDRGNIRVSAVVPSPNIADDPSATFEIDPGLRLRTQRQARETGDMIVGHFHSHPAGDPVPSATDRRRGAGEPELVWLIAGMRWGGVQGIAAWRLAADGGEPERLDLEIADAE